MAPTRAFTILEQRPSNENAVIGRTPLMGKNAHRGPVKNALKDLTNNSSSRTNLIGKQLSEVATTIKKLPLQKPVIASSVARKKSTENDTRKPAVVTKKPSVAEAPFPKLTQFADYPWGKEVCLRDDLLEQMIDYHGVVYKREIKPMKPLKMEPLDLPEIELPRPKLKKVRQSQPIPDDLPCNFLFGISEIEIPNLDFEF